MAIIYECDGCGKQSGSCKDIREVQVEVKSDLGQGHKGYNLCAPCERHLREVAHPNNWPRKAVTA